MSADMGLVLVASLLRRGRGVDGLSMALTVLAVALGLYGVLMSNGSLAFSLAMTILVVLGLLQKIYAFRVALDAELFEALAASGEELDAHTRQLDDALSDYLALAPEKAGRPWSERSRGALHLLRIQALLCTTQWIVALVFMSVLIINF